jgi:hypothetical protein
MGCRHRGSSLFFSPRHPFSFSKEEPEKEIEQKGQDNNSKRMQTVLRQAVVIE